MEILGVRVDNFSKKEVREKIGLFLDENRFYQIATVNPEFILQAQKDEEFGKVLNSFDLNVADGIGIRYSFLRYGQWLKCRFAGADLMREVLKMAEGRGLSVFLAINKDGLSSFQEIRYTLSKWYPNLKINGADLNPTITNYRLPMTDDCILFCNFGAPFQEKFINSQKNGNIRVAMGVGGSFDFLTGKAKRAPGWMRKIGLEWLWRGIAQPQHKIKRLSRIFKAVVVFPIRVILNK